MRLVRLAAICAAGLLAACDGTGRVITGISRGGGTTDHVLVFTVQPSNTTLENTMSPPVEVAALDTLGNTDTRFVSRVRVALGTNPSGAFLRGATAANAVSGVAVFGALNVDRVGTGFTLVASAPGATSATSAPFNVTAP
jgi:hypothetical protein